MAKLQEINDKHSEVMKVAADAEGTLNSIQHRRDDLAEQTNWSQPALLQHHMLIAEVMTLYNYFTGCIKILMLPIVVG